MSPVVIGRRGWGESRREGRREGVCEREGERRGEREREEGRGDQTVWTSGVFQEMG